MEAGMAQVKVVIYVSQDLKDALEALHTSSGVPVTEMGRRALAEYVSKNKPKGKRGKAA
jgi:hypothetical protein